MKEKRALVAAIVLAWLPLAISAAYPAMWQWSTVASSNGSSDPQINFREGQSPSSVNDSARALMAAVAGYRDDISGSLVTTGTASAYLVTTNQGNLPNPPADGQLLAITVNLTNGISPTLSADGGGAYAIQSSAGVAVPAGTLISGSPYSLKFSVANNAWLLRDFYPSPLITPLGGLVPYTGTTSPNSNYILPAGQCISTTTYAAYWVLMGSPASGSCSGGQFAVIDLRGRTLVALDNLNGTAANRMTSSSTGCGTAMTSVGASCANGMESQTLVTANMPPYSPSGSIASVTSSANGLFATYVISGGAGPQLWATNNGTPGTWPLAFTTTSTFTGGAQGGTSIPVVGVQPSLAVTYLLRVI